MILLILTVLAIILYWWRSYHVYKNSLRRRL